MKKFKFRLERVLGYRESVRQERRRELILKQRELDEHLQLLEQLQTAQLGNGVGSNVTLHASQLQLVEAYGARLREEIATQHARVAESEKAVEAARAVYIEASKDAESLVKFRERKQEQYRLEAQKADELMLDELTVLKGNPNSKEEH